MPVRRAVAYIRVSVMGDRAARGRFESPDLQRRSIDEWCTAHSVTVVDEFRDLNRSGGTLTRPGLEQAMQLIPGTADGIVVARGDRASRRTLHGLGLIEKLAERGGWIAAADDTIDTTTRTARMATTMHFAMGENELDRHREQSAVIHRRAIIEKGRHMGPAPFGYRRGDDGRLLLDEPEAGWVRHVFSRRADGAGWVQISRELDAAGVRQRNGRTLNPHMLRRLVARRVYVGEAKHGDHVKSAAHAAIVTEGLWAAANRAAPAVRSDAGAGRRQLDDSLLRGLLRCAGCRYCLKRQPQRGAPPRWRCRTLLTERSATHQCSAPAAIKSSESDGIERAVVEEFKRLAAGVTAEPADDTGVAELDRRAQEAEALLDELSALDVRKSLGAARWSRLVQDARESLEQAQQDLATARARDRTAVRADRRTLDDIWDGMTIPERQEALRSVVQAVMVSADGTIDVVPVWVDADLPRKGSSGFVVRPWQR